MSAQSGFWFPSMKIFEIISALESWGLRVSEDQIQRPTGEVVQAIYAVFLQQVTGITPEVLEEPAARAVAVIEEHQELYTASLNLNLMLHHVHRLAHAARVHDFCMRDLVLPEPERTRILLSAIINFIKFAEEREPFLKNVRHQSAAVLEERDRLRLQVAEMEHKVAEIKAQRAHDEPRCRALEEENSAITAKIVATKKTQTALVKDVEALKKDKSSLSRQKETIIQEVQLVHNAITVTRSRIVQSPDRIKKHISEMGVMAQEERMIVSKNEAKTRELKAKLDSLNLFEQDVKKCVDDLRSILVEHMQVDDIQSKLATFHGELERRKIYREQLLGRADRAKRQLRNAEDKLIRAQRHAEERHLKSEQDIQRLKREYEEMSEERRENDRHVEDVKREADEIERKMLEHLKRNEAELNELLAEYWNLRQLTEIYMETMANKLGMEIADA